MEEKLTEIFLSIFDLSKPEINDDLSPENYESWDSITHLIIITEIEDSFDVTIDEEKIPELISYKLIKDELSRLLNL